MRAGLLAVLTAGCAHVYQPMVGLQSPVVVDPTAPNLVDRGIVVRCVASDGMTEANRVGLCRRVGQLYEAQGARVFVVDGVDEPEVDGAVDLVVDLEARRVPVDDHALSWVLYAGTLTVLPAVVEYPFALDVRVRDGGGFLLDERYLEGRVVSRWGVTSWLSAIVQRRSWRRDSEPASLRAASEALSADVYGQLSQLAVNAAARRDVLRARSW